MSCALRIIANIIPTLDVRRALDHPGGTPKWTALGDSVDVVVTPSVVIIVIDGEGEIIGIAEPWNPVVACACVSIAL